MDHHGMTVTYRTRSAVDDRAVSALQAAAAGVPVEVLPWSARLRRHSLAWVQAYAADELVGFVNVAWDGGLHAFLLDTVVAPHRQHEGIGTALVEQAVVAAQRAGCAWLHVDYEPHLEPFYRGTCGFRPTSAGLVALAGNEPDAD